MTRAQPVLLSTLPIIQGALPMQKASTALLVVMVISSLSLWGCTNQKNGATSTKIRDLESRHAKLEEDYRVILAANEANRRKIVQLEGQRDELTQKIEELQAVVKERDELKFQLATRTEERDSAQNQLMQFTKDLQTLASRAQAAVARTNTLNAVPASRVTQ
jgi:outer membrane murein-binding lipoprotein Lpp